MTKEYYMPGYVDTAPQKEYPPHIQAFKNYIANIGNFQKHGYEKQDYSPDTSSYAPKTDSFGNFGDVGGGFRPDTSGFGNIQTQYRPEDGNYRSAFEAEDFKPNLGGFGDITQYRPPSTNYSSGFSSP